MISQVRITRISKTGGVHSLAKFQPSSESFGSPEWGEKTLRYIKAAVQHIESEPKEDIPPWVRTRLSEAATSLGMAVKYLQNQKEKKSRKKT